MAFGEAPPRHDVAVATVVLRALGMDAAAAAEVARRPLPELPVPQAEGGVRAGRKRVAAPLPR